MASKATKIRYEVLHGLNWPKDGDPRGRRAEIGEIVDDLVPSSIKWLLARGHIAKHVEPDPVDVPDPAPDTSVEPEVVPDAPPVQTPVSTPDATTEPVEPEGGKD